MAQKLILLALAGAMGTLARYGLGGAVQRACGASFPWGTAVVNLVGCFVFGVFWSMAATRLRLGGDVRAVALIGFLGAFTTFSTLVFETSDMLSRAQWFRAAANMVGQNVIGLLAIFAGLALGRYI